MEYASVFFSTRSKRNELKIVVEPMGRSKNVGNCISYNGILQVRVLLPPYY